MRLSVAWIASAALLTSSLPALADAYPTKPIRLIVPFPAGAANDLRARLIGQRLGKALGQQVVIENRPGASGTIAAQYVARAAPDGTSPEIVVRLNREVVKILASPEVRSHVAFVGFDIPLWTPQQFTDFIRQDRPRWAEVVKAAGVKAE